MKTFQYFVVDGRGNPSTDYWAYPDRKNRACLKDHVMAQNIENAARRMRRFFNKRMGETVVVESNPPARLSPGNSPAIAAILFAPEKSDSGGRDSGLPRIFLFEVGLKDSVFTAAKSWLSVRNKKCMEKPW